MIYGARLRPITLATLPETISEYSMIAVGSQCHYYTRNDLPRAHPANPYGEFELPRRLTIDEQERFGLIPC